MLLIVDEYETVRLCTSPLFMNAVISIGLLCAKSKVSPLLLKVTHQPQNPAAALQLPPADAHTVL
jgi:hypothetical protein